MLAIRQIRRMVEMVERRRSMEPPVKLQEVRAAKERSRTPLRLLPKPVEETVESVVGPLRVAAPLVGQPVRLLLPVQELLAPQVRTVRLSRTLVRVVEEAPEG